MKSLLEDTIKRLKERDGTLSDVAKGAGVDFYWLRKVHDGTIRNPSVDRVQRLWEYLSGQSLI